MLRTLRALAMMATNTLWNRIAHPAGVHAEGLGRLRFSLPPPGWVRVRMCNDTIF